MIAKLFRRPQTDKNQDPSTHEAVAAHARGMQSQLGADTQRIREGLERAKEAQLAQRIERRLTETIDTRVMEKLLTIIDETLTQRISKAWTADPDMADLSSRVYRMWDAFDQVPGLPAEEHHPDTGLTPNNAQSIISQALKDGRSVCLTIGPLAPQLRLKMPSVGKRREP